MTSRVLKLLMIPVLGIALGVGLAGCQAGKGGPQAQALVWPEPPEPARFFFERRLTSSTDIVPETNSERLKRMATGIGQAGKPLEKPWGVAAHDHRVYIGDTVSRKIHVYDMAAKTYTDFGSKGVGTVAKPLGMASDGAGKIYVTDGTGRRVVVFDRDGNFLTSIGKQGDLDKPSSVAVNKEGTRIYVIDVGGVDSDKHHVVVFDQNGEKLMTIGKRGSEKGEFNLPVGIAMHPNGNIYVVDGGNFRIQAFTPDGQFVLAFGDVGRRSGQFARPKDIAIDPDGNLYVTDSAFANIQIFNAQGQLLLFMGERGNEGGPAQYMLPTGISIDQVDGRVYVVDQFFRKVDVFRPAATPEDRPSRKPAPGLEPGAKPKAS